MKLKDYLKKKKISCKEFARMLGVTPQTISNYNSGKSYPSRNTVKKIEKLTGGKVKQRDFN